MNNNIKEDIFAEYGYTSICETGEHVLMWDFDDISKREVVKSLRDVQRRFGLDEIYIIRTRSGFHAICLDKFSFLTAYHILLETKGCDTVFVELALKKGHFVHRLGNDRHLIGILFPERLGGRSSFQKSNAHRILLNKSFNIDIMKDDSFDNNFGISYTLYERKIKKEVE